MCRDASTGSFGFFAEKQLLGLGQVDGAAIEGDLLLCAEPAHVVGGSTLLTFRRGFQAGL